MEDKEEKLGLLSDLIALAQADHHISEEEYQFIMTLAKRFDIDKETVHDLFHNPVESKPIVTELHDGDKLYSAIPDATFSATLIKGSG